MAATDLNPRDRILNVAGELFHRHGYGAVTVDDIIAALKVPPATFHRYFNSKEELGVAWLERLNRRMVSMHRSFMEKLGAPETRLKKYFYAMAGWLEQSGYRSCQFANTRACLNDSAEEMVELIDQYKRYQLKFFIELVRGIVGEKDAQKIGTAVFLLFFGCNDGSAEFEGKMAD